MGSGKSSFQKILQKTNTWTAKQTFADLLADQVEIDNAGGGANPTLTANSGSQIASLVGGIQLTKELYVNTIAERTSGNGINIDSLLIKDEAIEFPTNDTKIISQSGGIAIHDQASSVNRNINANNVVASNVIQSDTLIEKTSDAGVIVDGATIRDQLIHYKESVDNLTSGTESFTETFTMAFGETGTILAGRIVLIAGTSQKINKLTQDVVFTITENTGFP